MLQQFSRIAKANVFPAVCYLLATYFGYAFCLAVGIPPVKAIDTTSGTYLALTLFLVMLPEAKRLKLGTIFEYESRVQELKQEVKDFKDETRQTLATYSTLVSAISNTVNHTVNVNLPGQEAASRAKQDLDQVLTTKTSPVTLEDRVSELVRSAGGDYHYALAKLRMQLERELRRILEKRPVPVDPSSDRDSPKFLSTRTLFAQFADAYPTYERIHSSYDFVLRICNAAIHGQVVPEDRAEQALFLGARMLIALERIAAE